METETLVSDPLFAVLRPLGADAPIHLRSGRIYTVGRSKVSCDITVRGNRRVSRVHCRFFLDASSRKLTVSDGTTHQTHLKCLQTRDVRVDHCSTNGVFLNGCRVPRGVEWELSAGDTVWLGCCKGFHGCLKRGTGFLVEHVFVGGAESIAQRLCIDDKIERATTLLGVCRMIQKSKDPVSWICQSLNVVGMKRFRVLETIAGKTLLATISFSDSKRSRKTNCVIGLSSQKHTKCISTPSDDFRFEDGFKTKNSENMVKTSIVEDFDSNLNEKVGRDSCRLRPASNKGNGCLSDGKSLNLNRLELMDSKLSENCASTSLPELFHPIEGLLRVFIATFTCDVEWFLSCCEVPNYLPVTIACHDSERCWSSSHDSRTSIPYSDYPNLVLLYPPFPEEIAFGKDRKKRGVGCHHPKLFVLQREDRIRVIVTSANLVSRQWNNITNIVWWQDFPRVDAPNYSALFSDFSGHRKIRDPRSDFASQLAGFMASLLADAPQQAYWITELTKYNFERAAGYLVASVPGIHAQISPSLKPKFILSGMRTEHSQFSKLKFFGLVQASIVGLSHHFRTSVDSNGVELRNLAAFLRKCQLDPSGMSDVMLRRTTNIAADVNAVSVLVPEFDGDAKGVCVQLGFLPKDVAKWVSPLSDAGFFSFSASIFPREALAAAFGESNIKVQLLLHISQGPKFLEISRLIQPDHLAPLCSLLASIQRCVGLWRLQEILCCYRWPEQLETDFVYGSSSIGTSLSPQYLASFSSATGKRPPQCSDSQESDPEWGRWTKNHELKNPSLSILFPTIDRVKNGLCGVQSSRYLLAFSEKAWQRLRSLSILYDAVPHPHERLRHPMHVKVACRRFQSRSASRSFGWVYCGSHNFSPAAWGHQINYPSEVKSVGATGSHILTPRLHVCNYELGILFVIPPPNARKSVEGKISSLDDIKLPFVMPAPKYNYDDRPATQQAMREVAISEKESHLAALAADEIMDDEVSDEEVEAVMEYISEEKEDEKIYAEMLWSQVNSSDYSDTQ